MTDASQPWDGVPLHPETRRFHLLRHRSSGDEKVGEWWPPGEDAAGPFKAMWFGLRWGMPEHVAAEYEYVGPLYTQAEAAALADAAAAEMRTAASQAARSAFWRLKPDGSAPTVDEFVAVMNVNDAIMSLPLPAPSLDAIRAEERRILSGLRDRSLVAVPREPTEAMLDRAGDVIVREFAESDWEEAKEMAEALNPRPIWDAMLAAASDGQEGGR